MMKASSGLEENTPMVLTRKERKPGSGLISGNLSAGLKLGYRNFTKPHLSYRLGLLWVVLDPLLRAIVFSFLMIVIRGNTSPESLVIGVFTIYALNNSISSSMNLRLSAEPFPLSHTPSSTMIVSKITSDILNSIFLGLSSAIILILIVEMPIILVLVLPLSCIALSLIGSGVGLLLSPIVMIVKDISKIISYLLLLSFFLQCVLYPYSDTEGFHRVVLSWLPHTIFVEWARSASSGNQYPFSIQHAISTLFLWALPMFYGFFRFNQYRWRSTTWS